MRRASCPFLGLLVLTGMAQAQTPEVATTQPHGVSREDIEWLDAWLPHTNDHGLPYVLLIGDSITRGSRADERWCATRSFELSVGFWRKD
jgi:hypothetical protein